MKLQRFLWIMLLAFLSGHADLAVPAGAQQVSAGEWTWIAGGNTLPSQYGIPPGVYGTLGVAATGNTPGGRRYPQTWTDNSGNLWLFGGLTFPASLNYFNDLWKFDPDTDEWAWMNGSSAVSANCPVISSLANCGSAGTYGTMGTPSAANTPGARYQAQTWVDVNGYLWLYGGLGFDSLGNWGALDDLWRLNPSTNEWSWMAGSSTVPVNAACNACILGADPVPGTLGVPAPGNTPGGLWLASTWTDNSDDLWLFSGSGFTPSNNGADPNDLWQFNPSTSEWTWKGGDRDFGVSGAIVGIYGTLGVPATGNFPGARWLGATWTDSGGNFWLFGGQGFASTQDEGILNDLWMFNPVTSEWAWMGGSNTLNCANLPQQYCHASGVYGTQGLPAATNIPGSRTEPYRWKDANGNFWLFGGDGFDGNSSYDYLNDLWEYFPASNQWAWAGGYKAVGNGISGAGIYGTPGVAAPSNLPGIRTSGGSWTDRKGRFWLWGGLGLDSAGTFGYMNDMWVYQFMTVAPGLSVTGTSVSVVPGAMTGNISTLTVTPTGGFTGSVSVSAALTSSPAGAVNPPTFSLSSAAPLTLSGGGPATETLTVFTTASSAKACTSMVETPTPVAWPMVSCTVLASLFFFFLPRRNRHWRTVLCLAGLFAGLLGGLAGCGSGGQAPCASVITPGTTPGTYVIAVTVSGGAITTSGTVSVAVQ